MSTQQSTLTGLSADADEDDDVTEFERRWGISPEEFRKRQNSPASDDRPNEKMCKDCGNRVTVTNSGVEVGHKIGQRPREEMCPNHPENSDGTATQKALGQEGR